MTAEEFLKEANATIDVRLAENQDVQWRDKYIVMLRKGDEYVSFPFYSSTFEWYNGIKVTADTVLSSVQKTDPGDMGDYIDCHRYEINDGETFRKVERWWKASKNEYDSLLKLFGPELMEKLAEVNT